jgi:hypothetical protein
MYMHLEKGEATTCYFKNFSFDHGNVTVTILELNPELIIIRKIKG